MSSGPDRVIRDDVRAMAAYHVPPSAGMIKLDAMENPYRLPEGLRREIAEVVAGAEFNRYPDSDATALKDRLRRVMDIPEGVGILLGNGSDEIISMVTQAGARDGAVVMAPEPTFVMYRFSSVFSRIRYVGVPLNPDFSLDEDRFLAAMKEHRPALIFLAYPNNPSGNLFAENTVARIIDEAPGLVIVDEAYHAFARSTFLGRFSEFPNLMVVRTMSKLGLAGLRLGYAAARPEWIREIEKVRPPYNVGVLTQLVAEKVLDRHQVLEEQAAQIIAERTRLGALLAGIRGSRPLPSDSNFILMRVTDAPRVFAGLKSRGVLVKNLHGSHPLLDHCLRLTVGSPEENEAFLTALAATLAEI